MNRASPFDVSCVSNIWQEYRKKVFYKVDLESPNFLIVDKFSDNRVAGYCASFYETGELVSEYSFLPPPSEKALREAMLHEMVHHCDAVVNGIKATLKHGRYFFSWQKPINEIGFHLGRKVHWE